MDPGTAATFSAEGPSAASRKSWEDTQGATTRNEEETSCTTTRGRHDGTSEKGKTTNTLRPPPAGSTAPKGPLTGAGTPPHDAGPRYNGQSD